MKAVERTSAKLSIWVRVCRMFARWGDMLASMIDRRARVVCVSDAWREGAR